MLNLLFISSTVSLWKSCFDVPSILDSRCSIECCFFILGSLVNSFTLFLSFLYYRYPIVCPPLRYLVRFLIFLLPIPRIRFWFVHMPVLFLLCPGFQSLQVTDFLGCFFCCFSVLFSPSSVVSTSVLSSSSCLTSLVFNTVVSCWFCFFVFFCCSSSEDDVFSSLHVFVFGVLSLVLCFVFLSFVFLCLSPGSTLLSFCPSLSTTLGYRLYLFH